MCFAPQRRALFHHLSFQKCRATTAWLFHHLNFQKLSEHVVLFIFWSRNVLRATMACTFSTSQLPNVARPWKYASRHNGVQCFIFHLASWLRTRHFSEPTFRPSGATNHWKNTVFRDFPTFSRTWIFFLLRLSLFWSSFFFSSLLWLFPSLLFICPYCRKFDFYRQWPFGGQYPIFRPSISPLIY